MSEIIVTTREQLEEIVAGAVRHALREQSRGERADPDDDDTLLTRQQVAQRLQIGLSSVDNMAKAQVLTKIKIGRSVRFDAEQVDKIKALRG